MGTEAHAFAPLRFAHAVEMWYFGSLASRSPIRQAGTRTGKIRPNFVHIFSHFGIPLGLSFLKWYEKPMTKTEWPTRSLRSRSGKVVFGRPASILGTKLAQHMIFSYFWHQNSIFLEKFDYF